MREVIIVCEGQTEETFVKQVLAPELLIKDIHVRPRLIRTSRYSKGGGLTRDRVLRFLRNTLRERTDTHVTTFFDLYGLPPNFPGQAAAQRIVDPVVRAARIEIEFRKIVIDEAECRPERFLPHIQPCEFEALLFSDTRDFANIEPKWRAFDGIFLEARRGAKTPEHINDGADAHPSARLKGLHPRYNKVRHGAAVSAKTGIRRIRAECNHFNHWLTRLEELQALNWET